ncbi:MAG: trypsin-like peptidase domain-containing protein [Blastocatellia bacterium]|nr:trypsin-like peptidase domain-containing protein [Blastocatellia bacterium]
MLPIEKIVKALRVTRTEFGNLFLQAQVDSPISDRKPFEAVTRKAADAEAFADALGFAQAEGWLDKLVVMIIDEGLEDGTLTQELAESAQDGGNNATLQTIVDAARGFDSPYVMYRGIADGMKWTGKVLVAGVPKGTGILISPNLVLTAWHVVKELFRVGDNGVWEPDPSGGLRLEVVFDDFLVLVGQNHALRPSGPLRIGAHKNWCVIFSNCHSDELSDRLPADLSQLEGYWDYAVIRLSAAPGLERRWAITDPRAVVPRANERVILFQHPVGQPMKIDRDLIAPSQSYSQAVIPRFRFLHYVNTLGGSSGAPCFDKSFMLFGLHQGVWNNCPTNGRVVNRGIPIVRILEHIKDKIERLPALDPAESPIWQLDQKDYQWPVIGCESFQSMVWRSAVSGQPKLLVITGDDDSGKTFRVDLLSAMLSDGGHLKVRLNAENISKMDPARLAGEICATAGSALPPLTPLPEIHSTLATWLKDEVMGKIISALDGVRKNRLVWLSITELNQFKIEQEGTSQLLFLLYQQLLTVDWLRIVLDGMKGDIPVSLMQLVERHRTAQIAREDIDTYLRRFLAAMDLPGSDEPGMKAAVKTMFDLYQTALDTSPGTALKTLAVGVMKYASAYLEEAMHGANLN